MRLLSLKTLWVHKPCPTISNPHIHTTHTGPGCKSLGLYGAIYRSVQYWDSPSLISLRNGGEVNFQWAEVWERSVKLLCCSYSLLRRALIVVVKVWDYYCFISGEEGSSTTLLYVCRGHLLPDVDTASIFCKCHIYHLSHLRKYWLLQFVNPAM